jgi:hypothetical protein
VILVRPARTHDPVIVSTLANNIAKDGWVKRLSECSTVGVATNDMNFGTRHRSTHLKKP